MMRYSSSIWLILSHLLIALQACQPGAPAPKEAKPEFFKKTNIDIPILGVLDVQNCAKWYIDFSRIKRAVLYKDKIICVGYNGGFACLNSADFSRDTLLEKLMNVDFFTNASVFQDTLLAEKFDEIFFWNEGGWTKYPSPLPIKYFDLLHEDEDYAFYPTCMGEFGSLIFAYNKKTKETKANYSTCPNAIINTDSGYFIGTHLYHLGFGSESYFIKDVEALPTVPDSLRFEKGYFEIEYAFLYEPSKKAQTPYMTSRMFFPERSVVTPATFVHKGRLFHIIDNEGDRVCREIGTLSNDSLIIVDSVCNCAPHSVLHFGNSAIFLEYKNGFTLIRGDSLFKIVFEVNYPDYSGPKLDSYNFPVDTLPEWTSMAEATYEYVYNDPEQTSGRGVREITFNFGGKYKISGAYGTNRDGVFVHTNGKKQKMRFTDKNSFLKKVFTRDDRLFLFFSDQKYGLIEITDIEKFPERYREK